jgi:uncharacterized RDD family membrane protein YckC
MDAPGMPARSAGLFLVLAAVVYDALITLAVLFAAASVAVAVNAGDAIPAGSVWFELYLLAAAAPYFAWCWTHGGQTLGMRAWRLRIQRRDGGTPRWGEALLRYAGALLSWAALGLGFLWIGIDRERMSWHDRLSATRIVRE